MTIINSMQELRVIERTRQRLKDKKWKEGHLSYADQKRFSDLNLDASKTKSLRRWMR